MAPALPGPQGTQPAPAGRRPDAVPGHLRLHRHRTLELTGPLALRLWVSHIADDLDVFVQLEQYDADGQRIPAIGPGGTATPVPMGIGWLRASHRKLDPERTLPHRPWRSHDETQPLEPGVPTLLEVEIWPTSITLEPGQRLHLRVQADDDNMGLLAHNDPDDRKSGHGATIHLGGDRASHLYVPVIPN
jgi:predicted acyl esterase